MPKKTLFFILILALLTTGCRASRKDLDERELIIDPSKGLVENDLMSFSYDNSKFLGLNQELYQEEEELFDQIFKAYGLDPKEEFGQDLNNRRVLNLLYLKKGDYLGRLKFKSEKNRAIGLISDISSNLGEETEVASSLLKTMADDLGPGAYDIESLPYELGGETIVLLVYREKKDQVLRIAKAAVLKGEYNHIFTFTTGQEDFPAGLGDFEEVLESFNFK